jgi:manganese/zinc/iron transport system substrate-binding protein
LILEKNGVIDPHLWMDLSLWAEGIDEIVNSLQLQMPEFAADFQENGKTLKKEMLDKHEKMKVLLAQIPEEKRYLVTSHDAFRYFARAYLRESNEKDWELRFIAPEGLAPDGQLSPVDMHNVILFLQKHEISVLFPESNINRSVIAKIASASTEMGHKVRLCSSPLYGDSTSGLPYFEAMEKNGTLLYEELK